MSETDRKRYWDDAVHFTPDGYDLIGQKVGLALVSLLVKERTASSPRRRSLASLRMTISASMRRSGTHGAGSGLYRRATERFGLMIETGIRIGRPDQGT